MPKVFRSSIRNQPASATPSSNSLASQEPFSPILASLIAAIRRRISEDDGPVHPPSHDDRELLELSADALQLIKIERDIVNAFKDQLARNDPNRNAAQNGQDHREARIRTCHLLRRIGKIPARTPAGLFAKAALVRASKSGAAVLASSMANDMIQTHALRSAIWPAEVS